MNLPCLSPRLDEGGVTFQQTNEGIRGVANQMLKHPDPESIRKSSRELHRSVFEFLETHQPFHVVQIWNQIPVAAAGAGESLSAFRAGRSEALVDGLGDPPSSNVVADGNRMAVEFLAVTERPAFLVNRPRRGNEVMAAIHRAGEQTLMRTSIVTGECCGEIREEFNRAIQEMRVIVSQFNTRSQGITFGFGLEDLRLLRVHHRCDEDRPWLEKMLGRIVGADCRIFFQRNAFFPGHARVGLEGVLQKKGGAGDSARRMYAEVDGRIRVGSFELHVVEHCNLRCNGCDSLSPQNQERYLSVGEVQETCRFMAGVIHADVFKPMGGEPLLHPQIVEILEVARRSGISRAVRLMTNGLRLHRMGDDFWRALDHLTVSNYSSAPIPEKHMEKIERKAREFDVVLNMKFIDQFNEILRTEPHTDDQRMRDVYRECAIRHCGLIVRNGVFFKCTRAAYMDDFRRMFRMTERPDAPPDYSAVDGISLKAPGLADRIREYLNREEPLASCRYCLGTSGDLVPHRQLSKAEARPEQS